MTITISNNRSFEPLNFSGTTNLTTERISELATLKHGSEITDIALHDLMSLAKAIRVTALAEAAHPVWRPGRE